MLDEFLREDLNTKISYIETRDWTTEQCQDFFMSIQGGEKLKDGEKIHARTSNILNHKIIEIHETHKNLFNNPGKSGGMGLSPSYIKRYGHYEIIGTLIHMVRTNKFPTRPGKTAFNELISWDKPDNSNFTVHILDNIKTKLSLCLRQYQLIVMNVPRLKEKVKKEEHLRLIYFIYNSNLYQSELTDKVYIRIENLLNIVLNKTNPEFRQIITWGTGGVQHIYSLYDKLYHTITSH